MTQPTYTPPPLWAVVFDVVRDGEPAQARIETRARTEDDAYELARQEMNSRIYASRGRLAGGPVARPRIERLG